jgi:hypothetical protein
MYTAHRDGLHYCAYNARACVYEETCIDSGRSNAFGAANESDMCGFRTAGNGNCHYYAQSRVGDRPMVYRRCARGHVRPVQSLLCACINNVYYYRCQKVVFRLNRLTRRRWYYSNVCGVCIVYRWRVVRARGRGSRRLRRVHTAECSGRDIVVVIFVIVVTVTRSLVESGTCLTCTRKT